MPLLAPLHLALLQHHLRHFLTPRHRHRFHPRRRHDLGLRSASCVGGHSSHGSVPSCTRTPGIAFKHHSNYQYQTQNSSNQYRRRSCRCRVSWMRSHYLGRQRQGLRELTAQCGHPMDRAIVRHRVVSLRSQNRCAVGLPVWRRAKAESVGREGNLLIDLLFQRHSDRCRSRTLYDG